MYNEPTHGNLATVSTSSSSTVAKPIVSPLAAAVVTYIELIPVDASLLDSELSPSVVYHDDALEVDNWG
jgi:hypothetical protein